MKFLKLTLSTLFLTIALSASSQDGWTLSECIDYALKNNISVQQMMLRTEDQAVRLNTAENSRLPNLDANLRENIYFGRGPGRDGVYQDNTQFSSSAGLSANVPVFSGFSIKHNIAARGLDLQASMQDLEKAREDVSINVTSFYLQVLFNQEILKVALSQVALSREQLKRSEALVASGKNPESQIYESRSLLAKDELSLTQARNNLTLSILDLTQALNMDSSVGFSVKTPELDDATVMSLVTLENPQNVYNYAVENRPRILAEQFRLQSSERSLQIARASRYPQISLGLGYSNSYYYSFVTGYNNKAFGNQLNNNGNESIALSISVPIFNRLATRNQINSAKIAINTQKLSLLEAKQTLHKEIEQSYYSADAAYKKYQSAAVAAEAARIAFSYEQEKANSGLSTIFDFNDAKTRLEKSESDMVQAKFEFIFRRKILDFYAGTPLTLD